MNFDEKTLCVRLAGEWHKSNESINAILLRNRKSGAQRLTKARITIEIEYIEVNEFGAADDIDCDIMSNVVILNQIVAKTKSLLYCCCMSCTLSKYFEFFPIFFSRRVHFPDLSLPHVWHQWTWNSIHTTIDKLSFQQPRPHIATVFWSIQVHNFSYFDTSAWGGEVFMWHRKTLTNECKNYASFESFDIWFNPPGSHTTHV